MWMCAYFLGPARGQCDVWHGWALTNVTGQSQGPWKEKEIPALEGYGMLTCWLPPMHVDHGQETAPLYSEQHSETLTQWLVWSRVESAPASVPWDTSWMLHYALRDFTESIFSWFMLFLLSFGCASALAERKAALAYKATWALLRTNTFSLVLMPFYLSIAECFQTSLFFLSPSVGMYVSALECQDSENWFIRIGFSQWRKPWGQLCEYLSHLLL